MIIEDNGNIVQFIYPDGGVLTAILNTQKEGHVLWSVYLSRSISPAGIVVALPSFREVYHFAERLDTCQNSDENRPNKGSGSQRPSKPR